jgi:hypothetical protein
VDQVTWTAVHHVLWGATAIFDVGSFEYAVSRILRVLRSAVALANDNNNNNNNNSSNIAGSNGLKSPNGLPSKTLQPILQTTSSGSPMNMNIQSSNPPLSSAAAAATGLSIPMTEAVPSVISAIPATPNGNGPTSANGGPSARQGFAIAVTPSPVQQRQQKYIEAITKLQLSQTMTRGALVQMTFHFVASAT